MITLLKLPLSRSVIILIVPMVLVACELFDNPKEDCPDLYATYVKIERADLSSGVTGYVRGWWEPPGRCPNPNEETIPFAVDTSSGPLLIAGVIDHHQFPYAIDTVEVFIQRTNGFGVLVIKWGANTADWDTMDAGIRVYHEAKSPPPSW